MLNFKKNNQKGFTLVEIMVSLAIFTMVAMVALGAYLNILSASRKAQTLKTATNNVNFALESISREMRVGSLYSCFNSLGDLHTALDLGTNNTLPGFGTSCPNGGSVIAFNSSKVSNTGPQAPCNLVYVYYFGPISAINPNITIKKAEQSACGADIADDTYVPIISPDAVIDEYEVRIITASHPVTGPQPRATLRIKGHAGQKEKEKTIFDVQTTVSQRNQF